MKVAVVTDSSCGIKQLNIEMEGLYILPLQITDGVNNYLEGETITNDQCYQMMFMGKHMNDYSATFEPLVSLELCQLFRGSCATQFG